MLNINKTNLLKVFIKFPKSNILYVLLLLAFGEWLISDLFEFSGGNLGFIILCVSGYLYFNSNKPKFIEPKDLNGWVKLCEEDINYLDKFETTNNLDKKTIFRKNVLKEILENHEKLSITVIGDGGDELYTTLINKYFKKGTYNLNFIDKLPLISANKEPINNILNNDIVFYHINPPLTAKGLLWLAEIPADMNIWLLTSYPQNNIEKEEIEELRSEIPLQFKQKIINLDFEDIVINNFPFSLRINSINPNINIHKTKKRLLKQMHSKWQAEIEVIRRIKLRDIQRKNQLIVAASVFTSPVPSVDVLSMTVLNSLMINEIKSIWGCTWSPEILEKISKEILKTAIAQGVIEWSGQTLIGLLKLHGPNWLVAGSLQAISAAYLTRVVSRSLADFMAINKGVSEPDLEYIKNNSEKIVNNAFESEKINWQSLLEDLPNPLKLRLN